MRIGAIYPYNHFKIGNNIKTNNQTFTSEKSLSREQLEERADLGVFYHHIYEYNKGLRNLILTTEKAKYREKIEDRLQSKGIDYLVQDVSDNVINVFFGAPSCINVVKTFNNTKLNKLTPEQDFILGIMLGYDRLAQCERYIKAKNNIIKLGHPQE